MIVQLSPSEAMMAVMVGGMQHLKRDRDGLKDRYGADPERGFQLSIVGAFGEIVFAKAIGKYWTGAVLEVGAPDVGEFEVRTTRRHDGRLIIHDGDNSEKKYVLVRGGLFKWDVAGWILAGDAKQDRYIDDPTPNGGRPAYFVPDEDLLPIETLTGLT